MNKNNIDLEEILVDKEVEDELLEVPLTKNVFKVFFVVAVIIFLAVMFQVFNLGVLNHNFYSKSALANIQDTEIKLAPRGIIKDRFGNIIVSNTPSFRAFLSFKDLPKNINEREKILNKISEILGVNKEEMVSRIKDHDWRFGKFLLGKDLQHDEVVAFSSADIPGVEIEPSFTRTISHPEAFSHLVGYVGLVSEGELKENPKLSFNDITGKSGLEKFYNNRLKGINGETVSFFNADGELQEERVLKEAKTGQELDTFIDRELQEYFYKRLKDQIEKVGGDAGVGLVTNPNNGEVLSLVNIPSFDTTKVADFLNDLGNPLFNRAVKGLYNPGSTIKPLVAVAALEEGIVTPQDRFFSPGYLKVENPYFPDRPYIFHDWKPHGWVNLKSALARSSNVYFYIVGGGYKETEGLGIELLNKWWRRFRLDERTKIDLPGENTGILPNPEWFKERMEQEWRVGNTYNVSIGQGNLSITPVSLISYINAIANGGNFYQLRINKLSKPSIIGSLNGEVKPSTFDEVREGMLDVTRKPYGTAYFLSNLPFSVAAKTGSAQVGGGRDLNALFVGYAPVEKPKVSILVLIENAGEGGLNTVPVAKDVLMWYYKNRLKESASRDGLEN